MCARSTVRTRVHVVVYATYRCLCLFFDGCQRLQYTPQTIVLPKLLSVFFQSRASIQKWHSNFGSSFINVESSLLRFLYLIVCHYGWGCWPSRFENTHSFVLSRLMRNTNARIQTRARTRSRTHRHSEYEHTHSRAYYIVKDYISVLASTSTCSIVSCTFVVCTNNKVLLHAPSRNNTVLCIVSCNFVVCTVPLLRVRSTGLKQIQVLAHFLHAEWFVYF